MFNFLSQQLQGTLTKAFERHLIVEDLRTWINVTADSFLVKHHETKFDEGAWKIISCPKIQACTSKNIVSK